MCRDKSEKTPKNKKSLVEFQQTWKERTLLTVDEVAGLAPDDAQEEGIDEMVMEATEELANNKVIVLSKPFNDDLWLNIFFRRQPFFDKMHHFWSLHARA